MFFLKVRILALMFRSLIYFKLILLWRKVGSAFFFANGFPVFIALFIEKRLFFELLWKLCQNQLTKNVRIYLGTLILFH